MRRLFALFLAMLLLPTSLPLGAAALQNPGEMGKQTVMVYMVGSDLESKWGLATGDILEMIASRYNTNKINLLVMTGGTTFWKTQSIPIDYLSIFQVAGAAPKLLHRVDQSSMGEPDTLRLFLDYSVEHFPADSYGLIFWDHGGGPMVGIGADTLYGNDALTLNELHTAFSASRFGQDLRLEYLVFDACLMASLEVASLLSPFARYLIASEETPPGFGIDYDFLKDLGESDLSGLSAGRAILARTSAFYEDLAQKTPQQSYLVTLSVMDLDLVTPAQQALDALFGQLEHGLEIGVYSDIARRRDGTKSYGRVASTTEWDLIDLSDLARNMAGLYPAQAQAVLDAVSDLVIQNYSNVPRSEGVSIYFPLLNKRMFASSWAQLYTSFDFAPAYAAFVSRFGEILLSDTLGQWTGSEAPVVSFDAQTGQYFIQLTPEQAQHYERAEYYLLQRVSGEEFMLRHMSSDVTLDSEHRLFAHFDGKVMTIHAPGIPLPIQPYMQEKENLDGIAKYQIPALLIRRDEAGEQEILSAELLVDIDKVVGIVRITGAIRKEEDSLLRKKDVPLYEWDTVYLPYTSFYLSRDEEGQVLPLGDWVLSDSLQLAAFSAKQAINVRYEPLQGKQEDYFVLLSVVDTQGNVYSSDLMPLSTPIEDLPATAKEEEPIPVPFVQGSLPVLLTRDEEMEVTLSGLELSSMDIENRRAADTLHLYIDLVNQADEARLVQLDWVSANGFMLDAQASLAIGAKGKARMQIDLPIAPQPGLASMVQAGIDLLEEIIFQLSYQPEDQIFLPQPKI